MNSHRVAWTHDDESSEGAGDPGLINQIFPDGGNGFSMVKCMFAAAADVMNCRASCRRGFDVRSQV